MKFIWMKNHLDEFTVKVMANVLDISLSGFYDFVNRPVSKRFLENQKILKEIIKIEEETFGTYGSPRVTEELKEKDILVNHKKIESIMKENNISAMKSKIFRVKTTDSNHKFPLSPDLVQRNFNPGKLNNIWVSDITYIQTVNGFAYLTIFHDLGNREPVGWHLSKDMETESILKALKNAVYKKRPEKGLIIHSDREAGQSPALQYASSKFREFLSANNFIQSMSRKGNCWDNAVAESFFHTLKTECLYRLEKTPNFDELKSILFDYIEIFYIRKRRHSSLGYLSPLGYATKIA